MILFNGKTNIYVDNRTQNCARTLCWVYLVFSARERLYLTYPSVKDTHQEVKPSPYFKISKKI